MKAHIGERMTLRFNVVNKEGEDFTISGADYTTRIGDTIMAAGELVIKGHELSLLFSPTEAGIHRISIWYNVGTDRRAAEFLVDVVE